MSDLSDQRRYYERMIDEIADAHREQLDQLKAENARLKQELEAVGTAAYLYGRTDLADEDAKLRDQTELLVTLLRNDCDIEASWDGLRHFWSIELTDDGCLMRDRACKAEADNAKLRELLQDYHRYEHEDCYSCRYINECRADESGRCIAPMRLSERYRELGVPE